MEAVKDQNRVNTLIGVSKIDQETPTRISVNPNTLAIVVEIA